MKSLKGFEEWIESKREAESTNTMAESNITYILGRISDYRREG